ncbi:sugar ABC transporter ATP-binding protein [Paenibacillus sp. MB22_1]|uniref:sugar ABC transporter ATP-binding protein n=1 Tax=unclassified Paenibacillus TaxID=185978 RepID=UPI0021A936E6|nr:sugar ABC transporter ATP-binding protein [Paenibacillus sp. p3-SID1389]MCT2195057.1 sugar ABC transporter ATP-binding protein [Paenibacillus sp. p3-SID1389]
MDRNVLEMKGISKAFNGVKVLQNVDFSLKKGEVHALMGGNGAGKSTLMKILTGVYNADQGEIYIDGEPVSIKSFEDAQKNKISMIFQEFSLIPTLTVSQNIFLGREAKTAAGLLDDKENERKTERLLHELGVNIKPTELVQNLGVGYWQMTEIAKALSQEAKILIMDEPTSSLTKSETEILFSFIRRLKEKDYSIIYISHRMDEIFQICDRVTVMRDGKKVTTEVIAETDMDTVIQHIVGMEFNKAFEWKERSYSTDLTPVLEVKKLTSGTKVKDVSLRVYPGEIVGIAGLMGSGRTELLRAIFGIAPIESGEILIEGKPKKIGSVRDAIEAGLALIPEDRRMQGLVLQHSVKENMILPILSKLKKGLLLDDRKSNQISERFVRKLNIKTDGIFKQVNLLSGGNQQKIVLAKWLANEPTVLLLDEPTIGVDIGAKTEIIDIVREMADSGKGIVVVSSELPELLALSDRVIVLHEGRVKRELDRRDIQSEEELQYAIQGF